MRYQTVTVKALCNEDDLWEAIDLLNKEFPYAEWLFSKDGYYYLIVGTETGDVQSPADFRLYEDNVEEELQRVFVCEYEVYTNYGGFYDD